MSTLILMEKAGEGRMNVPPEKVEAYKQEGWVVIDRPPEPAPAAQAVPIEPHDLLSKSQSPAEEETESESQPEKTGRRSKKG